MAITIGGQYYPDISPGADRSTGEAEALAHELYTSFEPEFCTKAVVHRMDGLVLFFTFPDGDTAGYHFARPLCGYKGSGPMASAKILSLFEFGAYDKIYGKISHGGEHAHFDFRKPVPGTES